MVQIDYTTLGAAQLRRPLDGGRGHHGPVLARSAPGLLFLSPTNPAWPPRVADPLAGPGPADAGMAFVHGANEAKEGGPRRRRGGAPRAGSPLPFPHESSQAQLRGPPAWPTRVADAGVALVHGEKEAKEGGSRRRRGGAPRAGSPLPFPHESSLAHPPGRPS